MRPTSMLMLAALLLVTAVPCPAAAQDAPPVPAWSADYQIGPGDTVSIKVTGVREFDQSIRVSNSGRIRVPYVGVMFAAGMTAIELEREIARAIKEHELVNAPTVRVSVDQYRARPVYVVGEVTTPGQFVISGELYLLDALTRAGGIVAAADAKAFVYRRSTPRPVVTARIATGTPDSTEGGRADPGRVDEPSGNGDVIEIDLDELRNGTKPELNIPLQGGDVVYVPRRKVRNFYIIGDVKVPGAYTMPSRGEVTAAQAIIYAGGPLLTAKVKEGFLMRHDENGERQAIPVNFAAIIEGKQADLPIQAEDIIYIPNSAIKTIGVGLLNQIPRLLQQFVIF